jgi:hypothetical protein
MTTNIDKSYYAYSNGVYELKTITKTSENMPVAKTEIVSRRITGPIPRKEIAKWVEHIDLNSPNWQKEMQEALSKEQFIVEGINADVQLNPAQEVGMTKTAYLRSYFTLNTASAAAASVLTFFSPAIIAKYCPAVATHLHLSPYEENKNMALYSANAWAEGANFISDKVRKETAKIPDFIKTPILSYVGYKGLESLVEKVIQYPATDYKTWTALNLQKFLQEVYPRMIPENYQNDPVLKEVKSPDGSSLIRSPFKIDNPVEFGAIYEEHVLKNILSNQERVRKKIFCPRDGTTEIKLADVHRDEQLSDRIELRLLLLDAHEYKKLDNLPDAQDASDDLSEPDSNEFYFGDLF